MKFNTNLITDIQIRFFIVPRLDYVITAESANESYVKPP